MSEATPEPATPPTEAPVEATDAPTTDAVDEDFKSKFEAQQKVNRDLERKYKEAASAKDRLADMEAKLAKLEGKEAEYEALQARREVEQAALAKANDRILKAEMRAQAAGRLTDPDDALRFIDLSSFEVGDDGAVDTVALSTAVDNLITQKPYLAAQGGKRFQGGADGGVRNEPNQQAPQLTREQLKTLTPEQINEAKKAGQLNDLMGVKPN